MKKEDAIYSNSVCPVDEETNAAGIDLSCELLRKFNKTLNSNVFVYMTKPYMLYMTKLTLNLVIENNFNKFLNIFITASL